MIATWKRLGLSSEETFATLLSRMYSDQKLSHYLIAKELKADPENIRRFCKRYGIQARCRPDALSLGHQRNRAHVCLSTEELEVLDGLILGDGHLARDPGGYSARYAHGEKHEETLASISKSLPSLSFSEIRNYRGYFFFKSLCYSQLLPVWERWYGTGNNRVPLDLQLTPRICYWWFIGDGNISSSHYDIKLAADAYSDDCRLLLQRQFSCLGIKTGIVSGGRILLSAQDVPKFYEFIGPCRNPEYSHKWNYRSPRWTFQRSIPRGMKCETKGVN